MTALRFFALCLCLSLTACNPLFVMRAAYEESKILLGRNEIEDVIADPKTTAKEKAKLELVLKAREWAIEMGLNPKKSFTMYSRVDKDVLLWVLAASRKDKFELYTWWFPFVGRVPYKGFFDKDNAISAAKSLEKKDFETSVRGSEAFSTLGWFNDPVLSTTLNNDQIRIVNTVLHESVHSTIWIQDNVAFNESLANFIGYQASYEFFKKNQVKSLDTGLSTSEIAEKRLAREFVIADTVTKLYQSLDRLYKSDATKEEKLAQRVDIFKSEVLELRQSYPELRILKRINNADLMQLKFYLTELREFETLYQNCAKDWKRFMAEIGKINEKLKTEPQLDPFTLLQQRNLDYGSKYAKIDE